MIRVTVLRALYNRCFRSRRRFGLARDTGGRLRDPAFVSFLSDHNRQPSRVDLQSAVLRGRKLVRQLFILGLAGGGAWVLLESARALSLF